MRMVTTGKIGEFQPAVEDWTQYVERLEFSSPPMALKRLKKESDLPSSGWTDYLQTSSQYAGPREARGCLI